MAGRAYALPPPKPDVQPKSAGAEATGYEAGFTPRPRYPVSDATETWRDASDSVTNALHCNLRTRLSLAPTLDDATQRTLGVNTYTPGRKPAPRVDLSCLHSPERLPRPSGMFPRDLALTRPVRPPLNPDGGPLSGPGPTPPGLSPLPKAPEPVAKTEPPLFSIEITTPAPTAPTLDPSFTLNAPSPRVPGTLIPINFHLTGDTGGIINAQEVRVYGPIPQPFIIQQVWLNADSGVTPGQFVDILISPDGNTAEVANPTGYSIFPLLDGLDTLPAGDEQRGLAVPAQLQELNLSTRVDLRGRWIKVVSRFIAPAVSLPQLHVTIAVELMDLPTMTIPPLSTRPPLLSGASYVPSGTTFPGAAVAATGGVPPQPYATTLQVLPAWRVAALGLPPSTSGTSLTTYPALDSFMAWQLSPTSRSAKLFRDRIDTVLQNAGATGGNADTLVLTTAAIQPKPAA